MKPIAIHIIADFFDCPAATLEACTAGETILAEAVERSGLHAVLIRSHQFEPAGYTAAALLTESHITLHTWPELGAVLTDIFTCGDPAAAERAFAVLQELFQPGRTDKRVMHRGGTT